MKVGIFLRPYSPEDGGRYTFSDEIINSLLRLSSHCSHQFVVFGTTKEPPPEIVLPRDTEYVSIVPARQRRLKYRLTALTAAILKKLRYPWSGFSVDRGQQTFVLESLASNNIDMLWEPGPNCLSMDLPYVITVWDLEHRVLPYFPEIDRECRWDLQEQHYATKLRRASFVITETEAGKAQVAKFYQVPEERIKVLPFPLPGFVSRTTPSTKDQIVAKYNLSERYLFYPAQFWPLKNHANLLLAVQSLKEMHDLILPVVLCGSDKGNQAYINQMAENLNIADQVRCLGFVPREDLCSLYRNAFALVYVTFNGPSNLPPLEAFALRCPVIASRIVGAEEQLGDAALLVDPKQPEEIASAIRQLWDDNSLRQSLIERGLARVSKRTSDDYVRGIFSILDEFVPIRRCWGSYLEGYKLK